MRRNQKQLREDSFKLLDYLLENQNRYIKKEEICAALPNTFPLNSCKTSHDKCSYIWQCKDYVNRNIEIYNYIIITNSRGELKIPTHDELVRSLENEKKNALIKFDRFWKKVNALNLTNQIKLDNSVYEIVSNAEQL